MTAMKPYEAWLFHSCVDVDEVNKDYAQLRDIGEDEGIYPEHLRDALVEVVTVVAAELDRGIEFVWLLRQGKLERHESWKVRRAFQ